ncbi:MAG: hypothetical protein AAF663_11135 [Planctomycetota bacterium]
MSLMTACKAKLTSKLVTMFPERFATPGELHALWRDRLREAGLAVAEELEATPDANCLSRSALEAMSESQQHRTTRDVGEYLGRVLAMRVHHPVFTPDLLRDNGQGQLELRDVSGLRGYKGTPLLAAAMPMLLALQAEFKPSRAEKLRFYQALVSAWPAVPDGLHRLPRHKDFR